MVTNEQAVEARGAHASNIAKHGAASVEVLQSVPVPYLAAFWRGRVGF
jgi:hypothetical protein